MEFGKKNNEYPFFEFAIHEQAQEQLDSNLLLPYSDFDQGFKWDFTSFDKEEKPNLSANFNSFTNTNRNLIQLPFEKLPSFSEINLIDTQITAQSNDSVLGATHVQDLSVLNSTTISKNETQTKTKTKTKPKTKKKPKQKKKTKNIRIKTKRQRKRTLQETQETQETLPRQQETTKDLKTKTKPEIKNKQTEETNQAEPKKRTKKVDWLNLGVNLSEKEKTLLKRLSGKKNRELSQSDRLEWKRLRDRISARHSRQKKKAYLTNLESKVSKLQKEKMETDQKLSSLELENKSLLDEINKLKQIVQIRLQNCSNQNNLTQFQINNEPPNKQRTLLNQNNKTLINLMN
ncbi:cyclic amp response element-binding protein a [Anaeramoeba flamelloides]|uniref:Cyclic amp response element-binding protein a n=1 Tax=Anaeramoeba flamelloides TaxID=1746091 RepID=A0ABQ8XMN2_9EUKA|nr:cyclic amp response element-binding protein a [Anaeramoeba flamelloides]